MSDRIISDVVEEWLLSESDVDLQHLEYASNGCVQTKQTGVLTDNASHEAQGYSKMEMRFLFLRH